MSTVTRRASSLTIFLADGVPDGLRTVVKSGWIGHFIVCPRLRFPEARTSEEFARTGVYVLCGPSEESDLPTIYVGEGDPTRPRLEQHYRQKDFWTSVIVFTAKDQLNKAHVQYLESRLVSMAHAAKRCIVDNGNEPQLPALAIADTAAMENFLEEMLLIFPLLGLTVFEVPSQPPKPPTGKASGTKPGPPDTTLYLKARGIKASGYDRGEGFVVLAGSEAVGDKKCLANMPPSALDVRNGLVKQGVLVPDADHFKFAQDYSLNSPSQAAALVMGCSVSGLKEWKDAQGRPLKAIRVALPDDKVKPSKAPQQTQQMRPDVRGKPGREGVSLASLIAAGILTPPLKLFRKYKGKTLEATLRASGTVEFQGQTFNTPSTAAEVARATVTGRKMNTNGWDFWQYHDAAGKRHRLDDARERFVKAKKDQRDSTDMADANNTNAQPIPASSAHPPPATGSGTPNAKMHQARFAQATLLYNKAMATLSQGQQIAPADKLSLRTSLSVMNKQQLRSLHTALGGTAAIVGAQRHPWVHAIKSILSGSTPTSPPPAPATPAAPSPALVDDPHDLNRFVQAQVGHFGWHPGYEKALSEIKSGRKRSHWIWYIFPQLNRQGTKPTSENYKLYAIKTIEEARAYLAHPVLGPRLVECAEAVLSVQGRTAHEIFDSPDDKKLRNCATLFAHVSQPGSVFDKLLDKYFQSGRDGKTLRLLGIASDVK